MQVAFKDGKIIASGRYYENANYDMASDSASVVADGKGGISSYRVANTQGDFIPTFLSLDFTLAGESLSPYLPKRVEMVGRTQKVTITAIGGDLSITTFMVPCVNGVFLRVEAGFSFDLSVNYRGDEAKSADKVSFVKGKSFALSSSVLGDWVKENDAFYLSTTDRADILISFASGEDAHKAAFASFDKHYADAFSEIAEVPIPVSAETEEEKALYLSAYFTALENFKRVGEFGAFAAGVNYMDPLRTYYRDSYFTVLPLLHTRPDLVKEQILTLARGVSAEGDCPSAVKSDFTAFWGDHYDSPCFFAMIVRDYVKETEDEDILSVEVNGKPLLEIVRSVVDRLVAKSDKTGLIFKEGKYNKRDWADEVNREGYVTFDNVLFYRALASAAYLFSGVDDVQSTRYILRAGFVKNVINERLFNEEKGYYVNYMSEDFTEDNLSVDTVFAVLFGVADEGRAMRVLDEMESQLECKNNPSAGGEDFGVMCVYPPYKVPRATCHKSARPYDYHNGANWCYLTAMYACAKLFYGREWKEPLLSTFRYYTSHGYYTPVEYFSPCCKWGSALQGWSAAMAFAFECADETNDQYQ